MPKRKSETEHHPAFRVYWWDWRGHHDWVGRRLLAKGHRRLPPQRHAQDFLTRAAAEAFRAKLRRQIPTDELVTRIVGLRELLPPRPQDEMLPGAWPLQLPATKED